MLKEMQCPRCQETLVDCPNDFGVLWGCGKCEGTALTLPLLRKLVNRHIVNAIWQASRNFDYVHKLKCPGCSNLMEEVPLKVPAGDLLVDVCESCQFIWLDAGEWDDLPHAAIEPKQESRRILSEHSEIRDFEDQISGHSGARRVIELIINLIRWNF